MRGIKYERYLGIVYSVRSRKGESWWVRERSEVQICSSPYFLRCQSSSLCGLDAQLSHVDSSNMKWEMSYRSFKDAIFPGPNATWSTLDGVEGVYQR